MPKGGCTSLLWLMATWAGYEETHFHASLGHEIAPAMTVHDMSLWDKKFRWGSQSHERQAEIAADERWLRLTTVRNPATRLWSAWQSKLLLREPFYVRKFGNQPWFPRVPRQPGEVVDDFRAFVHALASASGERPVDVHWAPQKLILDGGPPLTHVGPIESMADTLAVLADHLGHAVETSTLRRENPGVLPFHPALYDADTAAIVNSMYADDLEAFGYATIQPASSDGMDAWAARCELALAAVTGYIDRHERIAVLQPFAAEGAKWLRRKQSLARIRRRFRR